VVVQKYPSQFCKQFKVVTYGRNVSSSLNYSLIASLFITHPSFTFACNDVQ
jgi:hypothetical protein